MTPEIAASKNGVHFAATYVLGSALSTAGRGATWAAIAARSVELATLTGEQTMRLTLEDHSILVVRDGRFGVVVVSDRGHDAGKSAKRQAMAMLRHVAKICTCPRPTLQAAPSKLWA